MRATARRCELAHMQAGTRCWPTYVTTADDADGADANAGLHFG